MRFLRILPLLLTFFVGLTALGSTQAVAQSRVCDNLPLEWNNLITQLFDAGGSPKFSPIDAGDCLYPIKAIPWDNAGTMVLLAVVDDPINNDLCRGCGPTYRFFFFKKTGNGWNYLGASDAAFQLNGGFGDPGTVKAITFKDGGRGALITTEPPPTRGRVERVQTLFRFDPSSGRILKLSERVTSAR